MAKRLENRMLKMSIPVSNHGYQFEMSSIARICSFTPLLNFLKQSSRNLSTPSRNWSVSIFCESKFCLRVFFVAIHFIGSLTGPPSYFCGKRKPAVHAASKSIFPQNKCLLIGYQKNMFPIRWRTLMKGFITECDDLLAYFTALCLVQSKSNNFTQWKSCAMKENMYRFSFAGSNKTAKIWNVERIPNMKWKMHGKELAK